MFYGANIVNWLFVLNDVEIILRKSCHKGERSADVYNKKYKFCMQIDQSQVDEFLSHFLFIWFLLLPL